MTKKRRKRKGKGKPSFYAAVHRDTKKAHVFTTWSECERVVHGDNYVFRKVPTRAEALRLIRSHHGVLDTSTSTSTDTDTPQPKRHKQMTTSSVHIYTDGSSLHNGTDRCVSACGVYYGPNDARNISLPLPGTNHSNNRAELFALHLGVMGAPVGGPVTKIFTDSEYAMSHVHKYDQVVPQSAENRDLVIGFRHLLRERHQHVEIIKVPAHSGITGNEKADELAKAAARRLDLALNGVDNNSGSSSSSGSGSSGNSIHATSPTSEPSKCSTGPHHVGSQT